MKTVNYQLWYYSVLHATITDDFTFHVLCVAVCFQGTKITCFALHDISFRFPSQIPCIFAILTTGGNKQNKSAVSSDGLVTWTCHIYLLLLLFLILAVLCNVGMEHSNEDVLQRILQYRILRGSGIWINIHKTDQTKKRLMMPGFSLYFTQWMPRCACFLNQNEFVIFLKILSTFFASLVI